MPFESRVFTLAKDAEHPGENQDACRVDGAAGIAVIADGVATGIFSRRWAEILVEAVVAGPPDPFDAPAMAAWLDQRRRLWSSEIDVANLAWFQKPKMRHGAFSTLLWVRLDRAEQDVDEGGTAFVLHARAIGDSCLMHVRDGQILDSFPIRRSDQLEADPLVVGSLDLGRDHLARFEPMETVCQTGDLVVLATDAIVHWALRLKEQGNPPRWDDYWDMSESDWQDEIGRLRADRQMRYDDATLALLRVVEEVAETGTPGEKASQDATVGPAPEPPAPSPAATESGATQPPTLEQMPAAVPKLPDPSETCAAATRPPPLQADDTVELIPGREPATEQDWKARLQAISEELTQQVGEQLSRGLEQLKKAKDSADEAIRKYREKFRSRDKK